MYFPTLWQDRYVYVPIPSGEIYMYVGRYSSPSSQFIRRCNDANLFSRVEMENIQDYNYR